MQLVLVSDSRREETDAQLVNQLSYELFNAATLVYAMDLELIATVVCCHQEAATSLTTFQLVPLCLLPVLLVTHLFRQRISFQQGKFQLFNISLSLSLF